MNSLRRLALESGKYAAASAVAFALDLGLLTFLARVAGWDYRLAAALSFVAGGVLLYVLCEKYVFRYRRVSNRSLELPYFIGLGLVGLAVNVGVIQLGVDTLRLSLVAAKVLASGCTLGINYLLRRTLLFSPSAQAERS